MKRRVTAGYWNYWNIFSISLFLLAILAAPIGHTLVLAPESMLKGRSLDEYKEELRKTLPKRYEALERVIDSENEKRTVLRFLEARLQHKFPNFRDRLSEVRDFVNKSKAIDLKSRKAQFQRTRFRTGGDDFVDHKENARIDADVAVLEMKRLREQRDLREALEADYELYSVYRWSHELPQQLELILERQENLLEEIVSMEFILENDRFPKSEDREILSEKMKTLKEKMSDSAISEIQDSTNQ